MVQVDWVISHARQYFALGPSFCGINALKFQQVILPDSPVFLELVHDPVKGALQFRYFSDSQARTRAAAFCLHLKVKRPMLDKKFSPERQSAFAARFEAQKIAFGPVVFQCVRYAWKRGMLQALADAYGRRSVGGGNGRNRALDQLRAQGRARNLFVRLGVVYIADGRYVLDKARASAS
ncbi:hypothetical protein LP419_36585 [Massilia sp. H-1]|nr:hypothetical protein LP419_36585 [Massilia sp. H-1]